MRVAVIILSTFVGLVMLEVTVIPMHVSVLISFGERPHEAVGSLALFALWMVATALVYGCPGVACWLFALIGVVGLYDGITNSIEEFTLWGAVSLGLAALTSVAHREKRLVDRRDWARTQHELAVHAALRSLHETMPELLARAQATDERDSHLGGLVALRPEPRAVREVARR
jgi:hypothetical protein